MTEPATARDRLAPYVADIARACAACGEDPFLLAGLILRESGAGWASGYEPKGSHLGWGDHGYAFGLIQADRRWHKPFIYSEQAQTPFGQFMYALALHRSNRRGFLASAGNFQDPDLLKRSILAAYNAGFGRVDHAVIMGDDPDSVTTGRNYAADVIHRAEVLRGEWPTLFDLRETAAPVA